jgi:hypothetical protein
MLRSLKCIPDWRKNLKKGTLNGNFPVLSISLISAFKCFNYSFSPVIIFEITVMC